MVKKTLNFFGLASNHGKDLHGFENEEEDAQE